MKDNSLHSLNIIHKKNMSLCSKTRYMKQKALKTEKWSHLIAKFSTIRNVEEVKSHTKDLLSKEHHLFTEIIPKSVQTSHKYF